MRLTAVVLIFLLGAAPLSLADAPKSGPKSEPKSGPKSEPKSGPKSEPLPSEAIVQRFGEAHPDCLEWTDGCRVCLRAKACSTPGIACTPKPPVCADPAEKSPIAPGGQKP